jgi:hypothetical protein
MQFNVTVSVGRGGGRVIRPNQKHILLRARKEFSEEKRKEIFVVGRMVHYNNNNDRGKGCWYATTDINLTASTLVALNWTSRINLNFALRIGCTRWGPDTVLDLRRHCHKGLLDIGRVLGRCLEEWNSELIGVFLQREKSSSRF